MSNKPYKKRWYQGITGTLADAVRDTLSSDRGGQIERLESELSSAKELLGKLIVELQKKHLLNESEILSLIPGWEQD